MAQWLAVLAALTEELSVVHRTHLGQLTSACDSSSRGPGALFLSLQALALRCTHHPTKA